MTTLIDKIYTVPPRILSPVREYFRDKISYDPFLEEEWCDGTFLNPPHGCEIKPWVTKLHDEAAWLHEIIALLPGQRFEQLYWQRDVFNQYLTAFCMVRKRVAFLKPDGTPSKNNPYGSFIYLYNGDWDQFTRSFGHVGLCVKFDEHYSEVES